MSRALLSRNLPIDHLPLWSNLIQLVLLSVECTMMAECLGFVYILQIADLSFKLDESALLEVPKSSETAKLPMFP